MQAGYRVLSGLVSDEEQWRAIHDKGDGDQVRRRLGTVGTSSPLFRLDKALSAIRDDVLAHEDQYRSVRQAGGAGR